MIIILNEIMHWPYLPGKNFHLSAIEIYTAVTCHVLTNKNTSVRGKKNVYKYIPVFIIHIPVYLYVYTCINNFYRTGNQHHSKIISLFLVYFFILLHSNTSISVIQVHAIPSLSLTDVIQNVPGELIYIILAREKMY